MKQRVHEALERAYGRNGYHYEVLMSKPTWIIHDYPEKKEITVYFSLMIPEDLTWKKHQSNIKESIQELESMGFHVIKRDFVFDFYYYVDFKYSSN